MTATRIEWAQAVWNPVVGCSIVSAGCSNCYAMGMAWRVERCDTRGKSPHYAGLTRQSGGRAVWTGKVAAAPDHVWLAPLRRRVPTVYFVNSMGDLFHEGVPDDWIDRAFAVMALCPQHKFIVLTKRAERMRRYLQYPDIIPLPNVALGVSVEDQASADERIPPLLATPAAIRLISAEPLLGPVDLNRIHEVFYDGHLHTWESALSGKRFDPWTDFDCDPMMPGFPKLDWVIAGGESGKGSRPCHPDWARGLRDQCAAAGVPFFWKQWGDWSPHYARPGGDLGGDIRAGPVKSVNPSGRSDLESRNLTGRGGEPGTRYMARVGKAKAGALLDGQLHRAAPDGWAA